MREGERVRILAQLIRSFDQVQLFSCAHEPVANGALDIQKEVGAALALEVSPALAEQRQHRLSRRLPVDPAAHDAYLRGRYYWTRRVHFDAGFAAHHSLSDEDFVRAYSYFETALELDPTYALGYVGMSNIFGATATRWLLAFRRAFPKRASPRCGRWNSIRVFPRRIRRWPECITSTIGMASRRRGISRGLAAEPEPRGNEPPVCKAIARARKRGRRACSFELASESIPWDSKVHASSGSCSRGDTTKSFASI